MSDWYYQSAKPQNEIIRERALQRQLQLTKPPGSLGKLEDIAVALSVMQGTIEPGADNVQIAVFAGDHGVANSGVSAFPQVVTIEMVKNFVRGGAAISVVAKKLSAGLTVINAGTISEDSFQSPVIDRPVAFGTKDFSSESAMSRSQCEQALQLGKDIADSFTDSTQIVIGGEMGIGNTSSATALAAAIGIGSVADLVGPGTGLDSKGISLKQTIIESSLARIDGEKDPIKILTELGGFEIAALTGYFIRSAQIGYGILVDGFISSVAALFACQLVPSVRSWMLFSHGSAEPGHKLILQSLNAEPILSLGMRLGEGSGSAVCIPLLRLACSLQKEMATFDEAGVSGSD